MFGVVPKVLWQGENPSDERNRIDMAMRILLLRDSERCILVDTGIGDKDSEKFRSIYAVDHTQWTLKQELARLGLTPDDISDVILTHLHFDHTGGAVELRGSTFVPSFPRARYYIQKRHWEWALQPSEKDRASFIRDNYVPLHDAGQLELLDGPGELFPGISLETVDGHTFAQQLLRVHDDEHSVFFAADLVPLSAHVSVPWVMAYDLQPLLTLQEKNTLMNTLADRGDILVFGHDPFVPAATIGRGERGFVLDRRGSVRELLASEIHD